MKFRRDTVLGEAKGLLEQIAKGKLSSAERDDPELKSGKTPKSAEADLEYDAVDVTKSTGELRYTLGPLYSPNTVDAHNEFVEHDELRKAVWNYIDGRDHTIRKQHGSERIGKVREIIQWPTEIETEVTRADNGEVRKVKYPAGTVFVGVQWSKEAWPLVKSRKIAGYSLGGRAVRIRGAQLKS